MSDENDQASVPTDFDLLLRHALNTQQPFYTALLNQMSGLETRQAKHSNELMRVRDTVNLMANQELYMKHTALDARMKVLEDERQQRRGVINATEWVPKVIQWLVILIAVIVFYLKIDPRVP